MRRAVKIRRNADQTVTVRIGRAVEHIDAASKDHAELFDAVKWAVLSKGVALEDVTLTEMLMGQVRAAASKPQRKESR